MVHLFAKPDSVSPETLARRKFGLWSLVVFILLLPPWWLWGADILLSMLKPLAGLFVRLVGLTGEITSAANGDWVVGTRLTQEGETLPYVVSHTALRRLALGFPLALAFLTAPPRTDRPLRALLVSVCVLVLVFMASLSTLIWGDLAAQLNPDLATTRDVRSGILDQPALHPLLAQIAIVGRYVGMTIAPLIAAILLWASLNPHGRALLMDDQKLVD